MKKFLKWSAYTVIALVLIVIVGVSYITLALPNVGKAPDIKIEHTPARIARGKYLANHVAVCIDCHSGRQWNKFAGPIDTTVIGAGGERFDDRISFPGVVYVPNITPSHIGNWTDGELYRAITTGVKKDGSTIFPIMPYGSFGKMDKEDIYSIIAYLRTLKPVKAEYPERKLNFPLNIIVNTIPQKAAPTAIPSEKDTLKYGKYLVDAAACTDCHTKAVQGKPVAGMEFAGGNEYSLGAGSLLRSANITPDATTGIGSWTKAQFIARFKQFGDGTMKAAAVKPGEFQTIMPWWRYGGMKETDLAAIYTYLKTLKPVSNKVVKFQVVAASR